MLGLPNVLSNVKSGSKVFLYAVDREFPVVGVLEKPTKVGKVSCLQEIGFNYAPGQWNKLKSFELQAGVIVDTGPCLVWLAGDSKLWDMVDGVPHATHAWAFDQDQIAWALEERGDTIDVATTQANRVYPFIKDRAAVMAALHAGTVVRFTSYDDRKIAAKRVIETALPGIPSHNIGDVHLNTTTTLYERLWDIAFNGLGITHKIQMEDLAVALVEQLVKELQSDKKTPYGRMGDFFEKGQIEFFKRLREESSIGGLQVALEDASDFFSGGAEDMIFEEQTRALELFLEMAVEYEILDPKKVP